MNFDAKNYYDVLEINYSASQEEIQQSYLRQRNSFSGDSVALYSLMSKDECDQMIELIEEAYSILSIPEKRREYDKARGIKTEVTISPKKAEKQSIINPNGLSEKLSNIATQNDLMSETLSYSKRAKDQYAGDTNAQSSYSNEFVRTGEHSKKHSVDVPKVTAYQKFTLDFRIDNNFEQEIENCTDYNGNFLKKIREYKNVSIERMSDMTRISKTYLKSIEEDNLEKLPALVYVRGFIYQYAKCLKLNPELVATSYLHYIKKTPN